LYFIEQFRKLNKPECFVVTQHSRRRLAERNITINDICTVIQSGEIIEDYPEDYPFPSCLIMGISAGRVIHIVASIDEDIVYLITAYIPDNEKWETDWKTRKGEGDK
jgi:hypothetical protein